MLPGALLRKLPASHLHLFFHGIFCSNPDNSKDAPTNFKSYRAGAISQSDLQQGTSLHSLPGFRSLNIPCPRRAATNHGVLLDNIYPGRHRQRQLPSTRSRFMTMLVISYRGSVIAFHDGGCEAGIHIAPDIPEG